MIKEIVISRKDLIEAIEAGIESAFVLACEYEDTLDPVDVEALREVGRKSERVLSGRFNDPESGCSCPLAQAGIWQKSLNDDTKDMIVDGFFGVFDDYIRSLTGYKLGPTILVIA